MHGSDLDPDFDLGGPLVIIIDFFYEFAASEKWVHLRLQPSKVGRIDLTFNKPFYSIEKSWPFCSNSVHFIFARLA